MKITKKEIFIILLLVIIALVRFFFFIPKPPAYESAIGKVVTVIGLVSDPPDVRLNNQRLTVTPTNQNTNILVVIPIGTEVTYGDIIEAQGTLETPENFITTSGKEFNYGRYLANQDIYFILKNASIKIISHNNGNILASYLYRLRDAFMNNISDVITPPESDLADGLVLGARGGFDTNMRNEFINTGTIHIIALSGYNVTIVAQGIMKVLSLAFSQAISIVFGMVTIILFIIMAGSSSTAIRAGIMACIALLGKMTGRTYDAGRALFIAGLAMIAYDPRVLTDISFQLSFLATFGILFVTPKVLKWVAFLPMKFGFRENVATTLAATLSVLPILLYSTGILSIVSLPANILILPLIPLTMLAIFIVGMFGFISPILSLPFGYATHLLLLYILSVIHFFASLPFASVNIQSFPLIIVFILYGFLVWWVWEK